MHRCLIALALLVSFGVQAKDGKALPTMGSSSRTVLEGAATIEGNRDRLVVIETIAKGKSEVAPESVIQANLEKSVAPIRSEADLSEYLTSYMAKTSPLDVLDAEKKSAFLASLVFTENGVASLRYDLLSGLSVYEAYRILGLFGWQNSAARFPSLISSTQVDEYIFKAGDAAAPNTQCFLRLRHDCEGTQFNRKCTLKQYGIGYACDPCTCTGSPP